MIFATKLVALQISCELGNSSKCKKKNKKNSQAALKPPKQTVRLQEIY